MKLSYNVETGGDLSAKDESASVHKIIYLYFIYLDKKHALIHADVSVRTQCNDSNQHFVSQ